MIYADDFLLINTSTVAGMFKNSAAGTVLTLVYSDTSSVAVTYDTAANRDQAFAAIVKGTPNVVTEPSSTLHSTVL